MSTFSPSLRIELITTGDQAGVWGNTTNTNLGTLVESAIAGYVSVSVIAANQALTAVNGAADQSRNMTIALTTTTGAAFNVYAPPAEKTYVIYNASAYAATLYNSTVLGNTTAAGAGAIIPAGKTVTLWSDGTNFVFQNNHLTDLTLVTDLAIADGGTGASTAANARTNLGVTATGADTTYAFRANNLSDLASASAARTNIGLGTIATQNSSSVSITGGSITGITDLAVADGGTGASTAADARTNLGLGTISTQNSNSVSITGGSITGITDLAVADGGTGASTAADARTNLGLGTMAVQEASNVAITGGSISGITDLAVADGGTGASTAADARTNLGLIIGTNIPSPTGTGASGSWGISITGNAATATTATALNTANNYQVNSLGVGTPGSAVAGEIRATNNITAYYSSDRKFKENIAEIEDAGAIVRAIGGKFFDWTDAYIADHGGADGYFIQKQDFGVIAQDVLQVFPRAIRTRPDGSLAVDYEKLGVLAFPALVEAMNRLDALEATVAKLANGTV